VKSLDQSSFDRRTAFRLGAAGFLGTGVAVAAYEALHEQEALSQATPEASPAAHGHMGADPNATPSGLAELPPFEPIAGEPLRNVEVVASQDGVLEVTLTASISETTVAGKTVVTGNFNGMFPGPTWQAAPGDTIKVRLENNLEDFTNLHTHGFHVSPLDNGDNVFVSIEPGTTFDYEYQIPDNHPSGMFWYHPHPHGITEEQNTSGMVGSIIITGGLDHIPGIAGLTQRHMFIQLNQFAENGQQVPIAEQTPDQKILLVNGQYQPTISIAPGETQRWSFSNAMSNNFCLLSLEGHAFNVIAKDGNPYGAVESHEQFLLSPAERVEMLVQAQPTPGTYELRQLQWGVADQAEPDRLLATVVIEGEPVTPETLPTQLIPYGDLRDMPIDNERTFMFNPAPAPWYQLINDTPFDPDVVNVTVKLGTLEKWTIVNTTTDIHPFHIHINDFQVTAINGEDVDAPSLADVVSVPANGSVEILHRFEDYIGKFVFHCHILMHEDAGMMLVVEVVP
jgi:suppressor of ftsI